MGEKVTFPSNGGTAHGYLAVPESGSGPGLIVIQEWWGLVDHIVDVTDRFAATGFVAACIARRIADEMERRGGLLSAADLAGFRADEAAPLAVGYRGRTVAVPPPPALAWAPARLQAPCTTVVTSARRTTRVVLRPERVDVETRDTSVGGKGGS